MRRLLVVVLAAFLGLPLVAAAPNAFFVKPVVIVYPFTAASSSVDREASARLATILAQQMADTGLVTVAPPSPGTERKDYLTVARAQNADYYVSGYISPLGNGVSVVEQVVSTQTGIVVFSQTAQLQTYNDATGQGQDLATFISRHGNRGLAAISTPPPQAATPTPAPSNGPEANLGKLFGRRKKAAATPKPSPKPSPTPVAAASAPAAALINVTPTPHPTPVAVSAAAGSGYAVVGVEGSADATLRELAAQRVLAQTKAERAPTLAAACAAHPVRAVLSGVLAVRPDTQFGGGTASFELIARDCAGKILWNQSFSNDAGGAAGQQLATERAVDAAVGAYLNPPKRRR